MLGVFVSEKSDADLFTKTAHSMEVLGDWLHELVAEASTRVPAPTLAAAQHAVSAARYLERFYTAMAEVAEKKEER